MLGSALKGNCPYCSPVDLLSLRDAHQRMPVPTIGRYYTLFGVFACSNQQRSRDAQSSLSILGNEQLRNSGPVRTPTPYRVMAQDLQMGM